MRRKDGGLYTYCSNEVIQTPIVRWHWHDTRERRKVGTWSGTHCQDEASNIIPCRVPSTWLLETRNYRGSSIDHDRSRIVDMRGYRVRQLLVPCVPSSFLRPLSEFMITCHDGGLLGNRKYRSSWKRPLVKHATILNPLPCVSWCVFGLNA